MFNVENIHELEEEFFVEIMTDEMTHHDLNSINQNKSGWSWQGK